MSKPAVPGRRMINTPIRPMITAVQRRQPTGSRRNSAAANVISSGVAWMNAAVVAKGMRASAVTKAITPMISARLRMTIGVDHSAGVSNRTPRRRASTENTVAPISPSTSVICPVCSAPAISLISASSTANSAMARIMKRLPRRLSIRPASFAPPAGLTPAARARQPRRRVGCVSAASGQQSGGALQPWPCRHPSHLRRTWC